MTAPAQAAQTRRALLIGIDEYKNIRGLKGCANDVLLMESVLAEQFGFQHTKKLLNGDATRENILSALEQLIEETQEGDVVVIHYAGHGSQIADLENDEASGMDSTLMPVDTFGTFGEPQQNLDITDDEIHLHLLELGKKTNFITLIVDACHSGTITRDVMDDGERGMPPDTRPPAFKRIPDDKLSLLQASQGERAPNASGWMSSSIEDKYVLIAGCRDEQRSGEINLQFDDKTVKTHGALTWYLTRELKAATATTTYRDVFERAAANVIAWRNGLQHPQMEGRVDRVVFGVNSLPPMKHIRVGTRSKDSQTVTLTAGSALGITAGSTFAVYPQGTKSVDGIAPLGQLKVTALNAVESEASIIAESSAGAIVSGARAVLTALARPDSSRVGVAMAGDDTDARYRELKARIESSSGLRLTSADAARLVVELKDETWRVRGRDGSVPLPVKDASQFADVAANLEQYSRYRYALELDNPDAASEMRGKFTMQLLRQAADGTWSAASAGPSGMPEFTDGDYIGVRITSNYDNDAHVNVLDFGIAGGIYPIYPPKGGEDKIAKGVTLDLFNVTGKRKVFEIPAGYPIESVETLKLFVTSKPANFEFLAETQGYREGRDETPPPVPAEDWTTIVAPFLLRKPERVDVDGNSKPVDAGHVSLASHGLAARVTSRWGSKAKADTPDALAAAGFTVRQAIDITPKDGATRDAAASLDIGIAQPPTGYGQVVMSTDENGVITWHFPKSPEQQQYVIPAANIAGDGERNPFVMAAIPVVKVLMFAVEPLASAAGEFGSVRWEKKNRPYRVRSVDALSVATDDAPELDRAGWERISKGRALLLLHGELSRTSGSFGALPSATWHALDAKYQGRIFAFDHFTLGHDPLRNAQELIQRMPKDLPFDVDILAQSRGGLIARVLAEPVDGFSLNGRQLKVGKVILVGTPSGGTALASENQVGELANLATNVVDKFHTLDPTTATIAEVVKHVAVGMVSGLPGLVSMANGSPFLSKLAAATAPAGTTYYAIGSEFTPRDAQFGQLLKLRASTKLLGGPNDLIVPSQSTWAAAGSALPPERRRLLAGLESESHNEYFKSEIVQERILKWLEATRA